MSGFLEWPALQVLNATPSQHKGAGVPEVPFRATKTKAKLDLRRWSTQMQTSQAFSHSENLTLWCPWPWDLGYQTGRVLR